MFNMDFVNVEACFLGPFLIWHYGIFAIQREV